jgi:Tfp pilus assembly protein PilF
VALAAQVQLTQTHDPVATLGRALSKTPLVLDEAEGVRDAVQELLAAMAAPQVLVTSRVLLGEPREQAVTVPPLSPEEAAQLWQRLAPDETGDTRALLARLDHHPLAIELAAARASLLHVDGLLRRIEAKGVSSLDKRGQPKSSLAELAESSWQSISPESQRCVALMTALPAPVLPEELEMAEPGAPWPEVMQELRQSAWIRPDGAGWRIPEPLAEWARERAPKGARWPGIVDGLVAAVRRGQDPLLERLLWGLAQDPPPAQVLVLATAALRVMRVLGLPQGAQELLSRAQAALQALPEPDPEEAAALELEEALLLRRTASRKEARALTLLARAEARPVPPLLRARLWRERATTLGMMGQEDEAQREASAMLAWAEALGQPDVLLQAMLLGVQAMRTEPSSDALLARGLALAAQLGDERSELWMRRTRAESLHWRQQHAEARRELEALLLVTTDSLRVDIEHTLAHALAALREHDLARAMYEQVIAHAEQAGLLYTACMARGNFGRFLTNRGDPAAEAVLLQVLAETEEMNNVRQRDAVRVNLGWLHLKRMDLERARSFFELCRRPDTEPRVRDMATAYLAEIAAAQGDLARVRSLRDELAPEATDERGQRYHDKIDALLAGR